MIMKRVPHRRLFLAGIGATAIIAASTRPGHSAETKVPAPPEYAVRRPRAEFEAARRLAKAADTPAGVEAVMLRELGPLPWLFAADDEGHDQLDVKELAPMSEPSKPGEITGMWAVARRFDPRHPEKGTQLQLIQLGRLWLSLGKRVEVMLGASTLAARSRRRYGADWAHDPVMTYCLLDHEPVEPLKTIVLSEDFYHAEFKAALSVASQFA